jgi:CheY-like chemotaxis protein
MVSDPAATPDGRSSCARHVLVINDTPEILALFRDVLEEEGYRVTLDQFAGDVGGKLRDVAQAQPDLIVLDFIIGGEPLGWQLLQALRMYRPTAGIPIVVCTAAVKLVTEQEGYLDDQRIGVVRKPFDLDHLLSEIARALARYGERRRDVPTG